MDEARQLLQDLVREPLPLGRLALQHLDDWPRHSAHPGSKIGKLVHQPDQAAIEGSSRERLERAQRREP